MRRSALNGNPYSVTWCKMQITRETLVQYMYRSRFLGLLVVVVVTARQVARLKTRLPVTSRSLNFTRSYRY